MSFSAGVYTLPGPALNTGDTVSATENNSFRNDVATAFNLTWLRNGTAVATANMPMGGFKFTGLGAGTTAGDSVRFEQLPSATNLLPVSFGGTGVGTLTGLAKGNGTSAFTAAVAGTDYLAPPSGTALLKANSGGALANAVAGTDYSVPTGTETLTNKTLTNPSINNYTEGVVAIGNTGTAQTLSLTNGTVQTATLTGNCTFTMPTATAGKSFLLFLSTGAGGFTGTFTGVKWTGGTAPTITTTASKVDILTFTSDGTSWYGTAVQNF